MRSDQLEQIIDQLPIHPRPSPRAVQHRPIGRKPRVVKGLDSWLEHDEGPDLGSGPSWW